ncbi:hypothetical protein [Pontimicrobium sp. IMCC45349]|jgi:hypothetical protein|uniref:hypothetical protein n=1 Tax=Pontimicrobium sp. IMCC45349 TaxID=3391574 RepID=UPI0039A3D231
MKTIKKVLVTLVLMAFAFNISIAQEKEAKEEKKSTMLSLHTDNVNFSMLQEYERLAKELKENCEKHNIQGINWTTVSIEDGRYIYVTPIKNMAELDNNPMSAIFEKMGKEAAGKLFDDMDKCYDSHSNSITHHIPELSHMPEGFSKEGKNHREYHFLYYAPKNGKAMYEAMKKVKEAFAEKGIKNGYDVYHSGFGDEESYFLVSVPATDSVESAQNGKSNNTALGEDGNAALFEVIKLAMKYDQIEGRIRPDLSYYPKSN